MANDWILFVKYSACGEVVNVENSNDIHSYGYGDVKAVANVAGKEKVIELKNVLFTSQNMLNLISISKVRWKGFCINTDDDESVPGRSVIKIIHKTATFTSNFLNIWTVSPFIRRRIAMPLCPTFQCSTSNGRQSRHFHSPKKPMPSHWTVHNIVWKIVHFRIHCEVKFLRKT